MPYNITHSEYISGDLTINRGVARDLYAKYKDNLAEGNFLEELVLDGDDAEDLLIEKLWWYGEWSGWSYKETLLDVLRHTKGKADILFVWEGGDGNTALRVENGIVTEKKIKIILE